MPSHPLDSAPLGLFPKDNDAPATARVELRVWLASDQDHPEPSVATSASLRIGAEGLCVSATTRTWYVPYTDLESHQAAEDHVLLRVLGGRRLELRTPAPHVLQQHLETRLTAFARHSILAQRLPAKLSQTTPTSQLLSSFENPATDREARLTIAAWLGVRPIEPGDALYLRRILREIADPELSAQLAGALDLDA